MRAALYARVSTTDKGQDTELQLQELREYAARRGWVAHEYVDEGVSGAATRRPVLDEMLKAARARKVDTIIVWRLDRLGRSLSHLLAILNEFEVLGVKFVSLRENIDMTTPTGRLMAHLIGAFAEFEREIISERVRAGIATAKRKGKRVGRNPTAPIVLQQIIELHVKKLSFRQIAKKTKSSLAVVQRTVTSFKDGTLNKSGLRTSNSI